MDCDLIVVGGGPIGLATGIEAALAGMSVILYEPRTAPVDKACGEGLLPAARAGLARLGVEPAGRDVHGIRYLSVGARATARFSAGPGLGVRRTVLSAAMTARADEVGVRRIVATAPVPEPAVDHVRVGAVRAPWLVAADGLRSPIRRRLGLDRPARGRRRFGLRQHYRIAPWSDLVEVHWADDAEAYVTPVADDLVGVAVLCGGGRSYPQWLAGFPALAERLDGAAPGGPVRGAGPLRQRAAGRVSGRVLLVGDAAGYVDAVTGEGISVGLACARELVGALLRDRPEDYEQAWRRATRRYRLLTGALVAATGVPVVRRTLVPAAQRLPRVFGAIVDGL